MTVVHVVNMMKMCIVLIRREEVQPVIILSMCHILDPQSDDVALCGGHVTAPHPLPSVGPADHPEPRDAVRDLKRKKMSTVAILVPYEQRPHIALQC